MSSDLDASGAPLSASESEGSQNAGLSGEAGGESSTVSSEAKVDGPPRPRDVPVATVVRLMGLPSAADLAVMDSKLDILSAKVATLAARVERISSQMMEVFHDFDRFDVQLADLREFMKQSLASVIGKMDSIKDSSYGVANGNTSASRKDSESAK